MESDPTSNGPRSNDSGNSAIDPPTPAVSPAAAPLAFAGTPIAAPADPPAAWRADPDPLDREPEAQASGRFSKPASLVALVLVALLVIANLWIARSGPYDNMAAVRTWGFSAAQILLFMIVIGLAINDRPAGLIIDNRNRVSLSKFQAACWTVLVVSALATMVAARIAAGVADPLAITIPSELLAALGLSATSLVATPALLSLKSNSPPPNPGDAAATAGKLGMARTQMKTVGRVFGRTKPVHARWLDMFRGDDVSNAAAPDLGKIQQFLLTLLVLGVYCAAVIQMFAADRQAQALILAAQGSLPPLSEQFVWLLGISHASYLAYKAVPHGPPPSSAARNDDVAG